MTAISELLSTHFGFPRFRPGQEEIVSAMLAGQDVLAIMPTGGGKSLCYQLPALASSGLTVVISPLIALMRDQVGALRQNGIAAGALHSAMTEDDAAQTFDALHDRRLRLLYLAPERLANAGTERLLLGAGVTRLAVDEAHCVSQWGHDFRPDYLRIGALAQRLGVPVAAFTATADAETREEIVRQLFAGREPAVFLRGFDRPNLSLAFAVKDAPRRQILDFAAARRGLCGIVYCGTRAKTETLAAALRDAGHDALSYHAGMDPDDRRHVEARFAADDSLIVVATVAFGMGVDRPDIRWVAHADLPKSVEAYYQEIGRAGRDGAPADTLTLFGPEDIRFRRTQIDESLAPPDRKAADHARLNALLGLAEAQGCRRQILLRYFGEETAPCGNCDLCRTPPDLFDGTEAVRMALSAVLRSGESYGAGHLIDILRGKATEKVRRAGHDRLPTFGVGKARSQREWQAILRQMMGHDLLRPDPERMGALRMTQAARPILRGEASIMLRRDTIARTKNAPRVRQLVSEDDAPLFSALKAKRRALAEAQRVPAYVIFPDRTLIEMAERKPATLDEMAQVTGVGAAKLERYGAAFLEVVTGAPAAALHPQRRKLAGRKEAAVFDRLQEVHARLMRGKSGLDKPLSCSTAQLSRISRARPTSIEELRKLLGDKKAARFAQAFWEVLQDAS